MQGALKLSATVSAEGKIEISRPELHPGELVEVIILLPEPTETAISTPKSVLEILRQAPGGQLFKTAEEVDAYIRQERDSWDR